MAYKILFLLLFSSSLMAFSSPDPLLTKHQIRVSTDEWPPFRIANKAGTFTGFDIDLLEAISGITDLTFNVHRAPWSRALKQLKHNQINMMTGLAYTDDRALYIDYIEFPYFVCHPAFYIQTALNKEINTYQELYQYKIGYVLNSAYFEPFNSDPKIKKHGVVTENQLLRMAKKGRLDVFIGTDCQVDYEITKQKMWGIFTKVRYAPAESTSLYLGIAKQQNMPDLANKLQSALIELETSGKLQAIKDRYFAPASTLK